MHLCQVSYDLLMSATCSSYGYLIPKQKARPRYSYQLVFCNYSISLFQIATLAGTPISYCCLLTTRQLLRLLLKGTPLNYFYRLLLPNPISQSFHLLVRGSCYYSLLITTHFSLQLLLTEPANLINQSFQLLVSDSAIKKDCHLLLSATRITYSFQVLLSVTPIYSIVGYFYQNS